jgi:hypothetical protein
MHMTSQNLRRETLNSAPQSSSAAPKPSSALPNPSSALPNSSSRCPKPSSRAQLETFFSKPVFTTLSRQTPCEFSAEKSTSHLSATPRRAPHDPRHSKAAQHAPPLIPRSSSAQHERTPNPQPLSRLYFPSPEPRKKSKHERSCRLPRAPLGTISEADKGNSVHVYYFAQTGHPRTNKMLLVLLRPPGHFLPSLGTTIDRQTT